MDSSDDWINHETYQTTLISNNQLYSQEINRNAGKNKKDTICQYLDNLL